MGYVRENKTWDRLRAGKAEGAREAKRRTLGWARQVHISDQNRYALYFGMEEVRCNIQIFLS